MRRSASLTMQGCPEPVRRPEELEKNFPDTDISIISCFPLPKLRRSLPEISSAGRGSMARQVDDARSFWGALGVRATGVAIITASGENGPCGFLALSATHLAASPPTMTISVSLTTSAYADIVASGHFAINYLGRDALDVYQRFSARDAPKGAERFNGLDYVTGQTGAPVFAGTTGALECKVEEIIERHGTALILGTILWAHDNEGVEPLVHFRGGLLK
jgi:flavin reductase (DIM6/NTAB) family NADH-FMN oxidoreductase RutF